MYREATSAQPARLQERNLLHKRITDLSDLREVYAIGGVIGRGNFGTVVTAKHKETKVCWAIKVINKRQAGASRVLSVEREIYILKLVNHPNIILLDCVFESPKAIYLVFELCTGSLAKLFKVKKQFQESETLNVIRSLSCALAYLHKNDIVHRDLKLENILIANNPDDSDDKLFIKVSDFGLSAVRSGPGHDNMLHDLCGTLMYMAPEVIATKSYSQQCDVWSMGIIMYVLLFGNFPFISVNDQQLCQLISKADIDFSGLPCTPQAQHLLSKLLEVNPAFRLTAAEVGNHPFVSGVPDGMQAKSSNVLDMMHLWRDEMLESSRESHNNRVSMTKPSSQSFESKEKTLRTKVPNLNFFKSALSMNAGRFETTNTNNNVTQEKSAPKSQEAKHSIVIKEYRRTSLRLPDFSHIPAKVDTNLSNLRKEAQRKREAMRKFPE